MSVIPGKAVILSPRGLCDALDGTNAPKGSMVNLKNLIPSLTTARNWIPRPAWVGLAGGQYPAPLWGSVTWNSFTWGGFGNIVDGAQINALFINGDVIYGMIAITGSTYSGKDIPFAYNWNTMTWYTVAIPGGTSSVPTTPATSGDWTPPTMQQVASRIVVTHPGFSGGTNPYFGWFDISSFSDATKTGNTNSSKSITSLSSDVLTAGWQVGMTITDSAGDIPANTTITAIASGGLSCTISNAATASTTGTTFTVKGGTPTAPLWGSGNTNLNGLTSVPVAVAQFNGRAYFAVKNGVQFSDSGNPTQITLATQALTFQNGVNVTALAGLPYNQLTGGPFQALIAFQGDSQMQQITGDSATSNLAVNGLGIGVGTISGNTIAQTPVGLMFLAPDGIRYIDFFGNISNPLGFAGDGVLNPFLNAQYPTRAAGTYNQDVYRITIQNASVSNSPYQEYWYHVSKKIWSGPHTSTMSLIQPRQGSSNDNDFVGVPIGTTALLAESDVIPYTSSVYTENGSALTWQFQPTLLPDTASMSENAIVETTIAAAFPFGQIVNVQATNENGALLNATSISGAQGALSAWGSVAWGNFLWQAQTTSIRQYDVPWTAPLVFKQMSPIFTGFSTANLAIGNLYMSIRPLGYRLQAMAPTSGGAI